MYQIVESLRGLAETLGVCVQTRAEVERIRVRGRRVLAVELTDGRIVDADVVIANADLPYVYDALIPRQAQSAAHRTRMRHLNHGSSAFLMFLGLDREYPELNHHDVYLSADVAGNFDAIFRHGRLPDDPSFYTCAAGRTDRSLAPAGKEGLYVLVPVPSSSPATDWTSEIEAFKQKIYDRLTDVGLQKLKDHVVFERIYTPDDFVADYNVTRGSAFGLSHSFFQVGYMRPANKAAGLDNLYFVGASTVPGGGVPMVIMGSRLTAERVEEDWAGA
ncbi:MAG: hypothetical protein DLM70_09740 [Chloroflexi bacterium]|nr:MAG: hypothetical protein DLM70_09740 [Chloroflexota bacterium]